MPRYVSKEGTWYPAKEHVVLPHLTGKVDKDGKPMEVYDGPDRAALFELFKAGEEKFGRDFRHDPEFIHRVKQLGFKNVKDYMKYVGYDEEKSQKEAEEKLSKVTKHELPERVEAIQKAGGGLDTSGGGLDKYGGFGPQPGS